MAVEERQGRGKGIRINKGRIKWTLCDWLTKDHRSRGQGHTDSFFLSQFSGPFPCLGMTSFIISCLCLCYSLNVLGPIAFLRVQESRTPSWCPENPLHASNTALMLDGHPNGASLCLITFYRLRLKSSQQLTHPQPKGRADAFPNASQLHPCLTCSPGACNSSFWYTNKQHQDWFHLGEHTGKGRRRKMFRISSLPWPDSHSHTYDVTFFLLLLENIF